MHLGNILNESIRDLDNMANTLYNVYVQLEVGQEVFDVPEGKSHVDAAFRGHGRGS